MRVLLAGDVMLGRLVNEALVDWPAAAPWGDTLSLFRGADWSFCNLEGVISDRVPASLPEKAFVRLGTQVTRGSKGIITLGPSLARVSHG